MLEMTRNVLKNKKRYEREESAKRKREEVSTIKKETYRAKLYDDMKMVDRLLENGETKSVRIEIKPEDISLFLDSMYNDEMSEYEITQVGTNIFDIAVKVISF